MQTCFAFFFAPGVLASKSARDRLYSEHYPIYFSVFDTTDRFVMNFTNLVSDSIPLSPITLGCWGLISDNHWGERNEQDSIRVIEAALDLGITMFDTAEMYGNGASEELLGKALGKRRSQVLVATKMHFASMSPKALTASCEASLQRLKTDYIDLYQIHWPSTEVPLASSWEAMRSLKQSGKVRQIGVCNCGPKQLAELNAIESPITNQLPYNLLTRAIEFEIIPACRDSNIGVLAYSPLLHGVISDRYSNLSEVPDQRARTRHFGQQRTQIRHTEPGCESEISNVLAELQKLAKTWNLSLSELALNWIKSEPQVASIIVGASRPEQLEANLRAIEHPLDSSQIQEINDVTSKVKEMLGSNADLWQSDEKSRIR